MEKFKIKEVGEKAEVRVPYNNDFVKAIRQISGSVWNGSCWTIPVDAVYGVRMIIRDIYGEDCMDQDDTVKLKLKLTVTEDISVYGEDISFCAKCLCHASGRGSGGKAGDDVVFIKNAPYSGGSAKNWTSNVQEGSVIILSNVNKTLYDEYLSGNYRNEYYASFKTEVISEEMEKKKKKYIALVKREYLRDMQVSRTGDTDAEESWQDAYYDGFVGIFECNDHNLYELKTRIAAEYGISENILELRKV